MTNNMITINGQQYHEPLGKGLPYYRIDQAKGVAAILPYGATNYLYLKEHIVSLSTFYTRDLARTRVIINSSTHNRLELSTTITKGRRISFPTYIKEGLEGPGLMYDHINNNEADDTDSNLRPVNATQNSYNKKLAKNNTSGFKGVVKTNSACGTWGAHISCGGKCYSGLTYANKEVAALAYNELARLYHGEHAGLNSVSVERLLELAQDPTTAKSLVKDLAKLDNRFGTGWSRVVSA